MGNSSKKPEDFDVVSSFDRQQWVREGKRNGYEIWSNNRTQVRADAYPIHASLKSNDLENYQLRKNNSSNIVKVHHVGIEKNQNLCSKSSQAVILTQRIPLRLDGVFNLSQSEALCVLRSAYNGFNTLGSFYGPIEPYEDMICFNEEGRPKVWLNSNLSLNQPQEKRQDKNKNKKDLTERNQIYVGKILDMVENRTTGYREPETLVDKFRQIGPKNYFQAINILEQYAAEKRIQIPDTIDMRSRKSLKGSGVDLSENNISQMNSSNQPTFRRMQIQENFNTHQTMSGLSNYNQNIPPFQSQATYGHFTESNHYNAYSIVSQTPNTNIRSRQVSFHSQPYQQSNFHQNIQPSLHFNNTTSHNLINSQHNQSNIIIERSRSGQIKQFQNDRPPYLPSPTIMPALAPIQYRPIQPAQIVQPARIVQPVQHVQPARVLQTTQPISRFDSPSKVVFNQTIQFNRASQEQISPQRVSNERVKTEEEIQNSSPNKSSPTKLGHIRKQNSQQFIAMVQPRVDPRLPSYVSIAESKKAQLEEEERTLQNQQANICQIIQESKKSVPSQEQIRGENIEGSEIKYEENLSNTEQKYIDNLEEQQAREQDELEQNPDAQYADYMRKQKIREEEEEIMRDQMERYENDDGESLNRDEENEQLEQQNQQENSEEMQIRENRQVNFQTRTDYLIRKNTDQNEFHNQELDEWSQRQNFAKYNNENLNKEATSSMLEENNLLLKQFGESQLQNATSQEYFYEVQNAAREQKNQALLTKNKNIQRVVSMEKKFTESSLGGSGVDHKVEDGEFQADFEPKREQPVAVESQYLRGAEKSYEKNNLEQIPEDARYEDIEAYIKQKYSSYLRDDTDNPYPNKSKPAYDYSKRNEEQQDYDVRKMAWYVESKYDQMKSSKNGQDIRGKEEYNKRGSYNEKQNYEEERVSDMLDVKNMQRSLDKKYSSMKIQPKIEDEIPDENQFDIKKLEQNLIRFEESRVGGGGQAQPSSQGPNFETSVVSKISTLENRADQRKSSISREVNFKQQNSYTYIIEKDLRKPSSNYSGADKQRDSFMKYANSTNEVQPVSKKYERSSKISSFLGSIDEKFNKYVVNSSSKNPERYSPRNVTENYSKKSLYQASKKSFEPSYRNLEVENETNYISSRLATAKFEYSQSQQGKKNALEPKLNSNKTLTYEQLRKYMWS